MTFNTLNSLDKLHQWMISVDEKKGSSSLNIKACDVTWRRGRKFTADDKYFFSLRELAAYVEKLSEKATAPDAKHWMTSIGESKNEIQKVTRNLKKLTF